MIDKLQNVDRMWQLLVFAAQLLCLPPTVTFNRVGIPESCKQDVGRGQLCELHSVHINGAAYVEWVQHFRKHRTSSKLD